MNSRILAGHVAHARLAPVHHAFRYPVYFFALDLDELDALQEQSWLFGHNRVRPLSLHDRDYLRGRPGPIREKLMRFLEDEGCADGIARIELVTAARWFHYAFNPVSFYQCLRADGSLRCAAAEVNNTFGERHLYILHDGLAPAEADTPARFTHGKEFHVSPFNDMSGEYRFTFSPPGGAVDIRVDLWKDGRPVFTSQLCGEPRPFTAANLRRILLEYPLTAALTVPRIVAQAARLYFGKKLPVFTKPAPSSPMTIGTLPPTRLQRGAAAALKRVLAKLRHGCLHLVLPDSTVLTFGGELPGTHAEIRVRDWRFFTRVLVGGDVGLGESYTDGDWDTDDIAAVIAVFIENMGEFDDREVWWSRPARFLNGIRHRLRPNSRPGSRKNISDHYDMGNGFYSKFLDATMMYSCALYRDPGDTLEQAQRHKIRAMIGKADIGPDHHVLEIGSGWGGFAIEAARQTGCRVTTVTLSREQLEWARRSVAEAGLADRVEVRLCDYRDLEGQYDRIVSIEMLEAVGHKYLGTFFRTCDRLLKPGGVLALQVITIPDQRYEAYRRGCDWIQKHIFPGGFLPSLGALCEAMRDHSGFVVENLDNVSTHYAQTLRDWRARFVGNWNSIRELGFDDRFARMWNYYLSYCESGFAHRALGVLQLVLARPNRPPDAGARRVAAHGQLRSS